MRQAAFFLKLAWRVFWPVLFLEIISFVLAAFLYPALDLQTLTILSDLAAFIGFFPIYLLDGRGRAARAAMRAESSGGRSPWRTAVFLAVFAAAACIVLNELINLFGISGWSESYEETETVLFSGGIMKQLLLMSVAAPLTEEVLFRGICFGRLREYMGAGAASFCSALWFGIFHGNIPQGLYGFAMGLLLALVYERYGGLRASVWFHAVANLVSVLITYLLTGLDGRITGLPVVAVLFLSAAVMGNCIRIAIREGCNPSED